MLIKELPANCKPREKAFLKGIETLGDDELLAILLRNGYKNTSAKELASKILLELNNLKDIENITINRLSKIKGVGKTKAITILTALEFGKRFINKTDNYFLILNNTEKVYSYLKNKIHNLKHEEFIVILLDNKKRLIDSKVLFKGDLTSVNVHPREIFKYAVLNSAVAIIVAHNHPTGDIFPSKQDIKITKELVKTGELMQIPVLDHLIIGHNKYYSFFESEILNEKN